MEGESLWQKYCKKLLCICDEPTNINIMIEKRPHKYNGLNIKYTVSNVHTLAKKVSHITNIQTLTCINVVEHRILRDYITRGHIYINQYLYKNVISEFPSQAIPTIKQMIPQKKGESKITYEKRIAYIYFVNLYNTIQKSTPLPIMTPFIVYRRVYTPYMRENTDVFYYTNSFSSTTQKKSMTHAFTNKHVYIYYVHPLCRYLPIPDGYSHTSYEHEILFTPYHRYVFIKKSLYNNMNYYHYVIFPTDIIIPSDFEGFDHWKKEISSKTSPIGGKRNIPNIQYLYTRKKNHIKPCMIYTRRNKKGMGNIFRKMYGKELQNQFTPLPKTYKEDDMPVNTPENNDQTYYDVQNRFMAPISSFEGKPPTEEEKKVIQKMLDYFGVKRDNDENDTIEKTEEKGIKFFDVQPVG